MLCKFFGILFISAFLLSLGVVSLQNHYRELPVSLAPSNPKPLSHADLVLRLSQYFPEAQLALDIPEHEVVDVPGYLPFSSKKSHDGQSLVSSYITDCSQNLWDRLEDDVQLPPGITKVERCAWEMRTFLDQNGRRQEITFDCGLDIATWSFVPQAQAGGWFTVPTILGWSPNDQKVVAVVLPIGCHDQGYSKFVTYDVRSHTWSYAPSGMISDDLSAILTTSKSAKNIPSCEELEGHVGGPYLTPNMVGLWDIEQNQGKTLIDKDKSLYQIVSVDWGKQTAKIKRFKMDQFITSKATSETGTQQCINEYDSVISPGVKSQVPFEVVTVKL
jgi:hypothetical protein